MHRAGPRKDISRTIDESTIFFFEVCHRQRLLNAGAMRASLQGFSHGARAYKHEADALAGTCWIIRQASHRVHQILRILAPARIRHTKNHKLVVGDPQASTNSPISAAKA